LSLIKQDLAISCSINDRLGALLEYFGAKDPGKTIIPSTDFVSDLVEFHRLQSGEEK